MERQSSLGDRFHRRGKRFLDRGTFAARCGELPNVLLHGWWIVDDEVVIELEHTEVRTSDPSDVALYRTLTDKLWSAALTGDAARAVLLRVAAELSDVTKSDSEVTGTTA